MLINVFGFSNVIGVTSGTKLKKYKDIHVLNWNEARKTQTNLLMIQNNRAITKHFVYYMQCKMKNYSQIVDHFHVLNLFLKSVCGSVDWSIRNHAIQTLPGFG